MAWDPANLSVVQIITPDRITTTDVDVKIGIMGSGFSPGMYGVFILHTDNPLTSRDLLTRDHLIPCNWITITSGDFAATLQICPRRKAAGNYDLVLWAEPPDVSYGENVDVQVPVNDIFVFPNAITVEAEKLQTQKEECALVARTLKQMVYVKRPTWETAKDSTELPEASGMDGEAAKPESKPESSK